MVLSYRLRAWPGDATLNAMRFLVAVVLAGCASHAATSPAWPKQHEAEKDGGESLSPHVASAVAAVEQGGNDEESAKPVAPPVAAPAATAKEPGAVAPTAPVAVPSDDPIMTEDIVIEIDD